MQIGCNKTRLSGQWKQAQENVIRQRKTNVFKQPSWLKIHWYFMFGFTPSSFSALWSPGHPPCMFRLNLAWLFIWSANYSVACFLICSIHGKSECDNWFFDKTNNTNFQFDEPKVFSGNYLRINIFQSWGFDKKIVIY